jgi:di/tricarboxylate transporter
MRLRLSRIRPVTDNTGMSDLRIRINRLGVGVVAGLCLLAAAVLWVLRFQTGADESRWDGALGACTRIGLFLGAVWIALPRTSRSIDVPLKVLVLVVAGLVGIVLRPRLFLPVTIVVGLLVLVLMPRNKASLQQKLARKYRGKDAKEPAAKEK